MKHVRSIRVRAFTACAFFLLIFPRPLFSFEPIVMGLIISALTGSGITLGTQWFTSSKPASPQFTFNNTKIIQTGNGQVAVGLPQSTATDSSGSPSMAGRLFNQLKKISLNDYGKIGLTAATTGYLYLLYSVSRMQQYLSNKNRIGLWFPNYEFNKLLLLDPNHMHELLAQEFMTIYQVRDQKSLKDGIYRFIQDLEAELACLTAYDTTLKRIETIGNVTGKCSSSCGYLVRTMVPLSGMILDCAPSINLNSLFFIDMTLKSSIQERISRIHYYKNIFLQSALVV